MALGDITLNDGQVTPVAHTFTFMNMPSPGKVLRADMSASPETPVTLTTGHQSKTTKSAGVVDSHLQRFDITKLDADGVTAYNANARLMSDVPRSIYSDALADDFAAYIRNWATSANVRAWLKGSMG